MPVFRVMLSGKRIVLKTEAGDFVYGFVRNEYVYALTRAAAVEKAKQRVEKRIAKNEAIVRLADCPVEITIDEVESGFPFWKLAVNESFIFFPQENDTKA